MREILLKAISFAKERMKDNRSGYDYYHAERVYRKAIHLAEKEGANIYMCGLAAILHDLDNKEILHQEDESLDCTIAREFLQQQGLNSKDIDFVCDIINFVSKRPAGHHMQKSIEALCVADANDLDAIGAIGIARLFAYGASKKRIMYNGDVSDENSIKYFYDRLFPIADQMRTNTGRELALSRKEFLDRYLQEFYYEWAL